MGDACVVHQDIKVTAGFFYFLKYARYVSGISHISGNQGADACALPLNLFPDLLQGFQGRMAVEKYMVSPGGKEKGDASPDAPGRAGDENGFSRHECTSFICGPEKRDLSGP